MFERFTEQARQVVVLAREEAHALKHNYIGTEHILLGLLGEREGIAGWVLGSLDVSAGRVRAQVVQLAGTGQEPAAGLTPFTPHAKKVLELALREALTLGHNYIGPEHILLGLGCQNQGLAARILLDLDADCDKIRNELMRALSGRGAQQDAGTSPVQPGEDHPIEVGATGNVAFPKLADIADSELDNRIDALLEEQRAISDRQRILQRQIEILHSERETRRRKRPKSDP